MDSDRTDHLATSLVFGAVAALLSAGTTTAILDWRDARIQAATELSEDGGAAPRGSDARTAPPGAPNVLFVLWDTTRADRMSLYGAPRPTTPRLAEWAGGAAVWDDAISPSYLTLPSTASLFTGLSVRRHGADAWSPWLRDRALTLAEWMRDHGWDTWGFSTNPNIGPATNLAQGFDRFEDAEAEPWATRARAYEAGRLVPTDASTARSPAWPVEIDEGPDGPVPGEDPRAAKDAGPVAAEALFAWLDARPDPGRPFFAFVDAMEAHAPRLPSMEARRAVGLSDAEIALGLRTAAGSAELRAVNRGARSWTADERAAMLGVYDATLWELDRATADLLAELERRGLAGDTIVVLVSDHGEGFGEHGAWGHNWSVYEELVHVPLVVRWRDLEPGRRPAPTSTADVFGTVAELAGVPVPGATTLMAPRSPVITELTAPYGAKPGAPDRAADGSYVAQRRRFTAIYDGPWKLVRSSAGERELYDRASDPGEQRDRATSEPDRVAALEAAMDAWLAHDAPPPEEPLSDDERTRRRAGRGRSEEGPRSPRASDDGQ